MALGHRRTVSRKRYQGLPPLLFGNVTMPRFPHQDRIAIAQIDALFSVVVLAVCGGAAAAVVLAGTLFHLGFLGILKGVVWTGSIGLCAIAHILLQRAYRRSQPISGQWRIWAVRFTSLALLEGLGWGWASVMLADGAPFDIQLIVVIVTLSVAAGAIPAFGAYLPAFFALFAPTTLAYTFTSFVKTDPVQRATVGLMLVFVIGMGALAIAANRAFIQLIALRLRSEELADDLKRQKEIAEQANLAKSSFLAAASHDLRQPVHALSLLVGALRGVNLPPEGVFLLDQMDISAQAMDGLFTALLDISRLDAGVVEVNRQAFRVSAILHSACQNYLSEANAKGVSLVLKPCSALVESDPLLLERILRNLISNAVRYTQRGKVLVGCRRRGDKLAIQVWDTGPGIPADQTERIFEEYYQLSNPERDRSKGLGLGLAIVRRLSGLLGCRVTLHSLPGRGSCFEIEGPIARAVVAPSIAQPVSPTGAFAKALIVVVDDEIAIREAMTRLLSGWGHEVIAAGSGDDAMRKLADCPSCPDLIICDYRLRHGENGVDVIQRLRMDYNELIPAMLITGDTAPDRLAEAQASGLLLLHKPVSNGRLRAAIVHLIAHSAASDG